MGSFKEAKQLIFRSLRRFISLCLVFSAMILTIRFYEFIYISNSSNYPSGSFINLLIGLKYDIVLILRISGVLMIPFLIISYFSQKAAKLFFTIISVFLSLGYILLLQYFSSALVPLGADLFGYSMEEIRFTIGTSGAVKIFPILFMAVYLIVIVRTFKNHVYYKLKPTLVIVLTVLMFVSLLPLKIYQPSPSKFPNEFSMFVAENKLGFFGGSLFNYVVNNGKLDDKPFVFKEATADALGNPFQYLDPEYPFLHKETTPDVLGEYFNLKETPPDIVFVIVESLGRAYTGENAYLGSFTPFLDSLMNESLYWENCLSTSGRTFQVLPSIMASLPFGKQGFTALKEKMPDHLSLIGILKKEAAYKSSFLYGSDASFDDMNFFMNRQGIDQIIDTKDFGPDYVKIPPNENGFTWGYPDGETFRRYLENRKTETDTSRSKMDVILTLSMHSPFITPDQDYYKNKYEERMNLLNLGEKERNFNDNYAKQFSTILYFDDSFREFIGAYKKLPEFENTIFIVTGDHRMPEIPISTQLDRFHVPLIIYSPMLAKTARFSSLVTHFDITPSLLALLNAKGFINRPKAASWIGHGLDNSVDYRNLNSYPLMRNKNELMDLIDDDNFIANTILYQVYPNLYIEPMSNSDVQKNLKEELNNFIRKNNFACENNRLIPDSLKSWIISPN